MSCNWPLVKLADVACIITTKIDANQITKDCYISTENMQPYKGGVSSADSLPSVAKFNSFRAGDTLFSNIRTYFEKVWLASFSGGASADVLIFRTKDESVLIPEYLYYFLSSPEFIEFTVRTSKGAKMPRGDKGAMMDFEFQLPPVEIQQIIACSLLGLERKIRLNSQTNQTLEEMAQAIFKSWFVDFDPVKAKMNGEQPQGMEEATASLFPEKLVESELGLIPDGWEVKPFSEWVKITKGKNITKKTIVDGDVPVVAGGLKPAYFHNAHNVDGPAITISASGANAGYVNLYFENIWASDCSYISQSTTPLFFLQYVALRYNQKKIFDMQTGAAQPHIYPRDFERLMIVVPNEELCRKLEEVFASFFRTVANNKQQNINLAALRDTLLPKLLSGEIELETK